MKKITSLPIMGKMFCIMALCLYWGLSSLSAQLPDFHGKRVGLYLSGRDFSFNEEYYMWINQFLKVEEDRSWGENVKAEFMIRVGEELAETLQELTNVDTVVFLNGDLERGKVIKEMYIPGEDRLTGLGPAFADIDIVLVLEELKLSTRDAKIVYIRSNRFVTRKVEVKKAHLLMNLFDLRNSSTGLRIETCYDEKESGKPPRFLDLHRKESELGAYLSNLFSQWWLQLAAANPSNCK